MFPNWTGWKTLKAILGAIGTTAATITVATYGAEAGRIAGIVGIVDGGLVLIVVGLSATALGPTVVPPSIPVQDQSKMPARVSTIPPPGLR